MRERHIGGGSGHRSGGSTGARGARGRLELRVCGSAPVEEAVGVQVVQSEEDLGGEEARLGLGEAPAAAGAREDELRKLRGDEGEALWGRREGGFVVFPPGPTSTHFPGACSMRVRRSVPGTNSMTRWKRVSQRERKVS